LKKILNDALLASVCAEASKSPRLRRNHNFHRHEEAVQRLLNAVQPGTYVQPHKHEGIAAFEMFVVLQGALGCVTFDETGRTTGAVKLSARGPARGLELPGETFHTIVCLEPDTVFLELKEGPYVAGAAKNWLPGYPDELSALQGDASAKKRVAELLAEWSSLCR